MNRIGENREHMQEIESIYKMKNLSITGIFSHLCRADSEEEEDILFTKKQIENFDYIIDKLKKDEFDLGEIHLQNSYGITTYREIHRDLARPGIILYLSLIHILMIPCPNI